MHTPLSLTRLAADFMQERGVENARLEAELLLAAVLDCKRLDLYLQFERPLTKAEVDRYREFVRRRLRREPLQYIIGETEFRELVLKVDQRALIPRPETELLVGEVLAWAAERAGNHTQEGGKGGEDQLTALEIGTGTGAIALSLALEGPFDRIVATDISPDALELAHENAELAGDEVARRVEFREGPLWTPIGEGETFDIVVSNPPYIAESEREELQPEVIDWEPPGALFAGEDGLDLIRELIAGAPGYLRPGGLLALEIGAAQGAAIRERIAESDRYRSTRLVRDLAGHDRIVLAEYGGGR